MKKENFKKEETNNQETGIIADVSKHIKINGNREFKDFILFPFSSDRAYGREVSNHELYLEYTNHMCGGYMDLNKNSKNLETDLIENGFQDSKGGRPAVVPYYMYHFAEFDLIKKVYYDRMWCAKNRETRRKNREWNLLKMIAKCVEVTLRTDISENEKVKQVKIITLKKGKENFKKNEQNLWVEKESIENVENFLNNSDMLSVLVSGISRSCVIWFHGLKGEMAFAKDDCRNNPFGAKVLSIFEDSTVPFNERCELMKCYIDYLYAFYNIGTENSATKEVVAQQTSRNFRKLVEMCENYSFGTDLDADWKNMSIIEKQHFIINKWFDGRTSYVKTLEKGWAKEVQTILIDNTMKAGLNSKYANTFANAFDTLLVSNNKNAVVKKEEIAKEIGINVRTLEIEDFDKTYSVADYFYNMKKFNNGRDVSYVKADMVKNYLSEGKTVSDFVRSGLHVCSKDKVKTVNAKEEILSMNDEQRIEVFEAILKTFDKNTQKQLIKKKYVEMFSFAEKVTLLRKGGK